MRRNSNTAVEIVTSSNIHLNFRLSWGNPNLEDYWQSLLRSKWISRDIFESVIYWLPAKLEERRARIPLSPFNYQLTGHNNNPMSFLKNYCCLPHIAFCIFGVRMKVSTWIQCFIGIIPKQKWPTCRMLQVAKREQRTCRGLQGLMLLPFVSWTMQCPR